MLNRPHPRSPETAAGPSVLWPLSRVSSVASSPFPIPPDLILIPMTLARRRQACRPAPLCPPAALLWWFGDAARLFIERRLTLVTTLFAVALVGGFVALRYL